MLDGGAREGAVIKMRRNLAMYITMLFQHVITIFIQNIEESE